MPSPLARRVALAVAASACLLVALPRDAHATPPASELMTRLGVHAANLEAQRTRASFALDGRMEELDRHGVTDGVKELSGRVDADGTRARLTVARYVEDGEDKTNEARTKARKRDDESREDRAKREIRAPFLASEVPKYVFDQVETHPLYPARVRIAFAPREPFDNAIEGSAWVDTATGTMLSASFQITKTSMFVEYVHVTLELDAKTPLGPAISKVTLEGKGGILFFRKHFRAVATLTGYRIAAP